MKSKTAGSAYLALLVIFSVYSTITWLNSDNTPQRWDESIHLMAASGFSEAIKTGPLAAVKAFITQESYYPPFVPFIGAFFGLGNPEQDSFTLSISLYMAALIIFTFLYTRRRFGETAAFTAAALVIGYPMIYGESHYFMFDIPLTAFLMASLYLMDMTALLQKRWQTIALGVLTGLAMLVKWTFLIYAAAPLIFLIKDSFAAGQERKKAGNNLAIAAAAAVIIALPWYAYNGLSIITNIFKYAYERGVTENLPAVFSMEGVLFYFKAMPGEMTGLFFALFIIGAALITASKEHRKELVYFLVPVLIFTLLHNKKDRYIMPVLPLAAIITAYAIYFIKNIKLKAAAACALAIAALLNFTFAVYQMPFAWPSSSRPSQGNWHIKDFLSRVGPGASLAIVPDAPYMNNIGYSFYTRNFYKDVKITGIFNFPMFADYFLVKTGDMGPVFSGADKRAEILKNALDPKSGIAGLYEKIYEARMPDDSTAMLYKIRKTPDIDVSEFKSDVNGNVMSMLSLYLKSADKFRFKTVYEGFTIKEMKVSFEKGLAGDFKHKDKGLIVQNADISVNDLVINPFAIRQGKLQIISLGSLEIRSLKVTAADLKDFALLYAKKMTDVDVAFDKGLINFKAIYSKTPVFISLELFNPHPGTTDSDIYFRVKKLKAGFITIPAGLVNFMLKDYNPLLNKSKSPVKLKFGNIKVENNELIITDK